MIERAPSPRLPRSDRVAKRIIQVEEDHANTLLRWHTHPPPAAFSPQSQLLGAQPTPGGSPPPRASSNKRPPPRAHFPAPARLQAAPVNSPASSIAPYAQTLACPLGL